MATTDGGVKKAWQQLRELEPDAVSRAAVAVYVAASEQFTVRSFGQNIAVSLKDRTISSLDPVPGSRSGEYSELFPLAVLWYLALAKDIALTGRLIHLEDLRGGDIFARGSHVLPLVRSRHRAGDPRRQRLPVADPARLQDLNDGPHFNYMVQCFMLAAASLAFGVMFVLRKQDSEE